MPRNVSRSPYPPPALGEGTRRDRMGERAPQCLRAVCGGSVARLQSSWSTRGVMVAIIGTSKICARWRSASPAALGEGAAWGRTVWIRRLQSMFQAAPPIRQFNPSRVIPFHVEAGRFDRLSWQPRILSFYHRPVSRPPIYVGGRWGSTPHVAWASAHRLRALLNVKGEQTALESHPFVPSHPPICTY